MRFFGVGSVADGSVATELTLYCEGSNIPLQLKEGNEQLVVEDGYVHGATAGDTHLYFSDAGGGGALADASDSIARAETTTPEIVPAVVDKVGRKGMTVWMQTAGGVSNALVVGYVVGGKGSAV